MSLLSNWTAAVNSIISSGGANLPEDILRQLQALRDEMEFYNYHGYDGRVLEFKPEEIVEVKNSDGSHVMSFTRETLPPPPPDPVPDDEPDAPLIPSSRRSAENALLSDFQKYQRGEIQ